MSEPAQAAPQKRARRGLRAALVLIAVVVVAGAALALLSHWKAMTGQDFAFLPQIGIGATPPERPASAVELGALEARITDLRQRLDAAEKQLGAGQIPSADTAGELQQLESRIGTLESDTAEKSALDAVESRVATLERENAGAERERAARILALALLARDASAAKPLKPALDAYAALAPGDPALSTLAPYAAVAVPTKSDLAQRFPESARTALAADRLASAGGVLGKLWARTLNLVSVRRIGAALGNSTQDRLARAQADLDQGNLEAATDETRALSGVAAETMSAWQKDAEARIAVDAAIADIDSRLVHALAEPPPQPQDGAKP